MESYAAGETSPPLIEETIGAKSLSHVTAEPDPDSREHQRHHDVCLDGGPQPSSNPNSTANFAGRNVI